MRKLMRSVILLGCAIGLIGCASTGLEPVSMAPLAISEAAPMKQAAGPEPLFVDHFKTDHAASISEDELRKILSAPVFLEERARLGIVPVRDGYGADAELPLVGVPGTLADMLDETGHFDAVSEVSTDFPANGSIAGLRELAARYRCDYLLLYRHRFVDTVYASGWAWTWATLVLPMIAPANTLESEGVVEATFFDVKSGTILFTSFARVKEKKDESVLDTERKQKALKEKMLIAASKELGEHVVAHIQRLVVARRDYLEPSEAKGAE
jgi:hypothetical protein